MHNEVWREVRLGEVCEIIGGGTPKTSILEYWNGEIPWLTVVDFNTDTRYVSETEKRISELGLNNSATKLLNTGDIIISARGTVGALAQLSCPMAFNQSCYGIRANEKSINNFLYYSIKNILSSIKANTHGSVFDTITRNTFDIFKILLPPISEQKAIADTLSCLDDKIELINRINKALEEMTQAIFKSWFVDFGLFQDGEFEDSELGRIPKGWKVRRFTEIVEVCGGGTPKTGNPIFWNGSIPFFTPKDCTTSYYVIDTEKHISIDGLNNCNSKLYAKNTVFVTARGTVGRINLAICNMAMNQSCYALRGYEDYSQFFIHQQTINLIHRLKHKANGAVFDAIITRDFDSELVCIPPKGLLNKFDDLVKPLYSLIERNQKEIKKLTEIRNSLLPKLMSGQIRVPVEEVQ